MAYNVLKGKVEGSVDQHGDQEIEGVKVFKSVLSASVFFDTDAGCACAVEDEVAFKKLLTVAEDGLLTYHGDKEVKSHHNLTFDGKTLYAESAKFKTLSGDAVGLENIPADKLSGKVTAEHIEYGDGIERYKDKIRIDGHDGIKVNEDGLSIDVSTGGGLGFKNKKLSMDLKNMMSIQEHGQNISDDDMLVVRDVNRNEIRHTTFKNLFYGYLDHKLPRPHGTNNSIQYKDGKELGSSSDFMYEPKNNTLNLDGTLRCKYVTITKNVEVIGNLEVNGAMYKDIKLVADREYDFQPNDNTVVFDTTDNRIVATLPPSKNSRGRIITVKMRTRSKGKPLALVIRPNGGLVDFVERKIIKANNSFCVLHCDGEDWWVIGGNVFAVCR